MFERLGKFVARHWLPVIVAWLVVLLLLRPPTFLRDGLSSVGVEYSGAPRWQDVTFDGDFAYLQSKEVEFVSPPTIAPNGERFVFLTDQDGTFLKLIETAEGEKQTPGPNLVRLVNTNMNVADLERSREFYRLLGFTESEPASQAGSGEFAACCRSGAHEIR